MKTNDTELNTEKKSIRGRFVIQEIIESDLCNRDSVKKRHSTLKKSKFKLIPKTLSNESKQTLFYVYDNMSCMYIGLDYVLKQYSIIYNSICIPAYSANTFSKSRLKLPSINQLETDDQLSYISNTKEHVLLPNNDQCDKSPLLKRNERKRIDSNVKLTSNSPFNLPKKIEQDSYSLKIKQLISIDNDKLLYSIQQVISIMLESQDFIEEKIYSSRFEV